MAECRLCGAALAPRFQLRVLGRHDVAYLCCVACGSLQTETPTWLDEAYQSNLADIDAGGVQRGLFNAAACYAVARTLRLSHLLDFGGGDGWLCRMLRDHGLDAYVQDRYAIASYAQGYTQPPFERPDLLSAFEVIEHFAQPREELGRLLAARPRQVLLSTQLYSNQGPDWWYLVPETGQHVFFYSRRCLEAFAAQYGYRFAACGAYVLLSQSGEARGLRHWLVRRLLLRGIFLRLVLAWLCVRPARGAWRDLEVQRGRAAKDAPPSVRPR